MKFGKFMEATNGSSSSPSVNLSEAPKQPWAGLTNDQLAQESLRASIEDGIWGTSNGSHGDDNEMSDNGSQDAGDRELDVRNHNDSDYGESDKENQIDGDDGESDTENQSHGDGQLTAICAIENRNAEESNKKTPGFFTLPYEIRQKIYRELLRADEPVKNRRRVPFAIYIPAMRGQGLQPQILATCRQINSECGNMLYDNTFYITVAEFITTSYLIQNHDTYLDEQRIQSLIFQRMTRLELMLDNEMWFGNWGKAVETIGRVLAHLPELKCLCINILSTVLSEQEVSSTSSAHTSIWRGFMMIRNVQQVTVRGLKPVWQQLLIERMTSSTSIPRMYYALELFAKPIESAKSALEQAYQAACLDDLKKFVSARQKVIRIVNDHMKQAAEYMFSFDLIQ